MKKVKFPILISLVTLLLVVSNLFVYALTEKFLWRVDMTRSGLYSVTDETYDLMKTVNQKVNIYCISKGRDAIVEFSQLLDKYEKSSEYITVTYIDPYTDVIFLDRLKQEGIDVGLNTIVVEGEGKRRVLKMADMYRFSSDGTQLVSFHAESLLTSAVMNVVTDKESTMGILMGHGEEAPSELQNMLVENGYKLAGVVLNQPVREEIETIYLLAPQSDFSENELIFLEGFLERGGTLLAFHDPSAEAQPNLNEFLKGWGIVFESNVVFDARHNVEGSAANVIGYYVDHEITDYFKSHNYYVSIPASSSINQSFQTEEGTTVNVVLTSADEAYGRSLDSREFTTEKLVDDTNGPFVLAVTSERIYEDSDGNQKKGRIFASGSKRIYSDEMMNLSSVGNAKLMTKVLEWGSDSTGITFSIPGKQVGGEPIPIQPAYAYGFGAAYIALIPLLVVGFGLFICFKRKCL